MSDARWLDVDDDLRSAVGHFARSVEIFERGGFSNDDLQAYMARMALMQAMQSGYTSLESAFERILEILEEEKPTGPNYHTDLLRRLGREIPGNRPSLIGGDLAMAIDEARRFRHVARRSYDNFHVEAASSAVKAAGIIRDQVGAVVSAFRQTIDPD